MIKKVLIVFRVLLSGYLSAQEYEPLVDTTKQWNFLYHVENDCKESNGVLYDFTFAYRFRGDTLLNGLHYKKLELCMNDSTYKKWRFDTYCIREDVDSQKVHVYEPWESENLLYDFSLNEGDSLVIYGTKVRIDSVATKYIANKNRKVQYITCYMGMGGIELIEGIGTKYGLLDHYEWFRGRTGTFPTFNLLCYSQNNEIQYQSGDDCFVYNDYTSISNTNDNNKIIIFPTPASEKITIVIAQQFFGVTLSLYSIDGRFILRKEIESLKLDLHINNLNDGLYFIAISKGSELLTIKRIIINH